MPETWLIESGLGTTIADSAYDAFPDAQILQSGRIVVAWSHYDTHYGPGHTLAAHSDDNGLTWSPPVRLMPDGGDHVGAAGLAHRGNRVIALLTTPGPRTAWVQRSDDGGVTWSPQVKIEWGIVTECFPSDIIWLDNGTPDGLILATGYSGAGAIVAASTDAGQTWAHQGVIKPYTVTGAATETGICQDTNGDLLGLIRNNATRTIEMVRSTDDGATWTTATTVLTNMSGLPRITLMPDGSILATLRQAPDNARRNRWMMGVSIDNGATWTATPVIPGEYMMYGRYLNLDDGTALLVGASEHHTPETRSRTWVRVVSAAGMFLTGTVREPLAVEIVVTGMHETVDEVVMLDGRTHHQIMRRTVAGTSALLEDYTAPTGEATYLVRALAGGVVVAEANLTVLTPEPPQSHVWISDPLDETSAVLVPLLIEGDRERPRHATVATSHTVGGRVISSIGPRYRGLWQIVIHATDPGMINRLQDFFDNASSVLIRGGSELFLPGRMYGAIPASSESLRLHRPQTDGAWAIDIQPDDGPGIDAIISTWTWEALEAFCEAHDITWDNLGDTYPTWLDLERGPVGGGE